MTKWKITRCGASGASRRRRSVRGGRRTPRAQRLRAEGTRRPSVPSPGLRRMRHSVSGPAARAPNLRQRSVPSGLRINFSVPGRGRSASGAQFYALCGTTRNVVNEDEKEQVSINTRAGFDHIPGRCKPPRFFEAKTFAIRYLCLFKQWGFFKEVSMQTIRREPSVVRFTLDRTARGDAIHRDPNRTLATGCSKSARGWRAEPLSSNLRGRNVALLQTTDVESTLGGRSSLRGLVFATWQAGQIRIPTEVARLLHDLQMGEEALGRTCRLENRAIPRSWRARGVPGLKHNLTETLPS